MINENVTEIFADGIVNVSHANGVFRVIFGQQEPEGEVKEAVKLFIPASQIAPVIQALTGAVNDISEKIKQNAEAPAVTPAKKPAPKRKRAAKSTRKTTR